MICSEVLILRNDLARGEDPTVTIDNVAWAGEWSTFSRIMNSRDFCVRRERWFAARAFIFTKNFFSRFAGSYPDLQFFRGHWSSHSERNLGDGTHEWFPNPSHWVR